MHGHLQTLEDSPPELDVPRRDINIMVLLMQAYKDAANGPNNNKNNNTLSDGYSGRQTVENNKQSITDREVMAANATRTGYHATGAPDMALLKHAVQTGLLSRIVP